uniref:Uncharacterized protein n=1 Tax=Arundo donax TaxID=35708 RepID=A0A0A9HAI4_ARUDO
MGLVNCQKGEVSEKCQYCFVI